MKTNLDNEIFLLLFAYIIVTISYDWKDIIAGIMVFGLAIIRVIYSISNTGIIIKK